MARVYAVRRVDRGDAYVYHVYVTGKKRRTVGKVITVMHGDTTDVKQLVADYEGELALKAGS